MKIRISDTLIRGSLILIGLTEAVHLAGCLLGWSFSLVTKLWLGGAAVLLLAAVLFAALCRHNNDRKRTNAQPVRRLDRTQSVLTAGLALFVLIQILRIVTGGTAWLSGDLTLETVNTFLSEDAVYTVNPLTGAVYSQGLPLRLKVLCLPTLYGVLVKLTGLAAADVVYRLIPCIVLLLGYLAYGRLAGSLFAEKRTHRLVFLLVVGILWSAGAYMPGVDGFNLFYGGFRGVTIRGLILIPYLIASLIDRKYVDVVLCILAEACIVWTMYGAGVCLLITVAWVILELLLRKIPDARTERRKKT